MPIKSSLVEYFYLALLLIYGFELLCPLDITEEYKIFQL